MKFNFLKVKLRHQLLCSPSRVYGCETWPTTKYLCARLDVFDMWALRRSLGYHIFGHVTNAEVQNISRCQPHSLHGNWYISQWRLTSFSHNGNAQR